MKMTDLLFAVIAAVPTTVVVAGDVIEFERVADEWLAAVGSAEARAFDEFFPSDETECLATSPATLSLEGGTITVSASDSKKQPACPIADTSSFGQVSDGWIVGPGKVGVTLRLEFTPPVAAFYCFYGSLETGNAVHARLIDAKGRSVEDLTGPVSEDDIFAVGHGFTSVTPIKAIEFVTDEPGPTMLGAFVGLLKGEPSLGSVVIPGYVGPDGTDTIQLDFACVFLGDVVYVDSDSVPGTGTSWDSPVSDLTTALHIARHAPSVEEIWVAAGTYKPSSIGDRAASFELVNGVAAYGGFTGTETTSDERDPEANPTILSGDLLGDDGPDFAHNEDDSYHVVRYDGAGADGDDSPTLDGFTITAGNADGEEVDGRGGGVLVDGPAGPVFRQCQIVRNAAVANGGGVSSRNASLTFEGCIVDHNWAVVGGGIQLFGETGQLLLRDCEVTCNASSAQGAGLALGGPGPNNGVFINCLLANNGAGTIGGGAISTFKSEQWLINCTVVNNGTLFGDCGGIRSRGEGGSVILENTIVWFNEAPRGSAEDQQVLVEAGSTASADYSCIEGLDTLPGTGSIGEDPRFADPIENWGLQPGSPCIDAADNTVVPEDVELDLSGDPRFLDDEGTADTGVSDMRPPIDMGAYEFQGTTPPCLGDTDANDFVDFSDLLVTLGQWGPCPPTCLADFDGDGTVGFQDLLIVLAAWGPCP